MRSLILAALVAIGAAAAADHPVLLSRRDGANTDSTVSAALSADGTVVTVRSQVPWVQPIDGDGYHYQIFSLDRTTGIWHLESSQDGIHRCEGSVGEPAMSPDGRFLAFAAGRLLPDDSASDDHGSDDLGGDGGLGGVYLRDREADRLVLVSSGATDQDTCSTSAQPLSDDGRFVCYLSRPSAAASDQSRAPSLWLRDCTASAPMALTSTSAVGPASAPVISGDGAWLAYADASGRIVLRERASGSERFVDTDEHGARLGATVGAPSISGDGRVVAFIVDPRDPTGYPRPWIAAKDRVSGAVGAVAGRGSSTYASAIISRDGTAVVFSEAFSPQPSGQRPPSQCYRVELASQESTLLSVALDGGPANRDSACTGLSADGRHVLLTSEASDLVAGFTDRGGPSTNAYALDLTSPAPSGASGASTGAGTGTSGGGSTASDAPPSVSGTVDGGGNGGGGCGAGAGGIAVAAIASLSLLRGKMGPSFGGRGTGLSRRD